MNQYITDQYAQSVGVLTSQPTAAGVSQATAGSSSQPGQLLDFGIGPVTIPTPSIPNPIGGLQAAGDFFSKLGDFAGFLNTAGKKLLSPGFWKGLGLVLLAVPLVIVGTILWTGHGRDVTAAAKTAAKDAPEAAAA